ncbi:QRFP-like peptide receptor [Branchiostoma floridae]|uniref:QRFP-like peptide receptor n=1 Tax=Branchiostoma floridae TaxID=7739 RepID=A0A9J7MLJ0_BRAFL|nr:QRFP-like peptide receptor [Branchiostoma floridae]XP_035671616.1 QRFP-like peptide receptor [Branchiostoma floridae]
MDDFDLDSLLESFATGDLPTLDTDYGYNISSQDINTYVNNISDKVFRKFYNYETLKVSSNAQIALILVYGLATFLSLVGNSCVVVVLTFVSQKWTELNIFLVNLAIADLTMALFCIPFTFTEVMLQDWMFGETMCPVVRFTQVLSVSVSIYILLAIGIDRYYAVVHPLKIRVTRSRAKMVVVVIWIVSTALASVQLAVSRTYPYFWDGLVYERCDEIKWPNTKWQLVYTLSLLGVTYVIPLILLCGAYIGIGLKMWGRRAPGNSNRRWDQQHERTKKKTIKMLCIVVLMFAICWLPIHLFTLILDFKAELIIGNKYMALVLYFSAHWLAMSNSFMNPIVYSFMNDKFRSDLMRLFGCSLKKKDMVLTRDKQTTINFSERNALRYTLSRSSAVGSGSGRSVAIQTMNGCRLHRADDYELRPCADTIQAAPPPSSDHSTTSEGGKRNGGIGRTSSWPPPDLKELSERRTPRVRARLAYFYLKQKVTKKNPKKKNTYKDTPPRVLYKVQQDDRLNNATFIEQTVSSV